MRRSWLGRVLQYLGVIAHTAPRSSFGSSVILTDILWVFAPPVAALIGGLAACWVAFSARRACCMYVALGVAAALLGAGLYGLD